MPAKPYIAHFCGATPLRELYDELANHGISIPDYEEFFDPMDKYIQPVFGQRPDSRLAVYEDKEIFPMHLGKQVDEIEAAALLDGAHRVSANPREALRCAADDMFWVGVVRNTRIVVLGAKHINRLAGTNQLAKPDFLSFSRAGTKRIIGFYGGEIGVFPANTWFLAKKKES